MTQKATSAAAACPSAPLPAAGSITAALSWILETAAGVLSRLLNGTLAEFKLGVWVCCTEAACSTTLLALSFMSGDVGALRCGQYPSAWTELGVPAKASLGKAMLLHTLWGPPAGVSASCLAKEVATAAEMGLPSDCLCCSRALPVSRPKAESDQPWPTALLVPVIDTATGLETVSAVKGALSAELVKC